MRKRPCGDWRGKCFKCLEKVNRLDIPVYQGAASPLKRPFVSAQDTHGMDGLGETYFPRTSKIQAQALSAADYLAQTFQQATDCSIIALGPLTNIALALKRTSSGAKSSTFCLNGWYL